MFKLAVLLAICAVASAQWPNPPPQWNPQPPTNWQPENPTWQQPPAWQNPQHPIQEEPWRPGVQDSRCPRINGRMATLMSHETQCNMFYICNDGLRFTFECPQGLNFDRIRQICDRPADARC